MLEESHARREARVIQVQLNERLRTPERREFMAQLEYRIFGSVALVVQF